MPVVGGADGDDVDGVVLDDLAEVGLDLGSAFIDAGDGGGGFFGAARGILFVALFIIAGEYAGFDNDDWWKKSNFLSHFEVVAEWIMVMAPQGYDLLVPDSPAKSIPIELD